MLESEVLINKWKSGELSDAYMAAYFFIHYHQKKYPNKKLMRAIDQSIDVQVILNQFVFKKVRPKALIALKKWLSGEWDFKLVTKILTPYEVLAYQANGVRPVTMKIQNEFSPILHKEDCLEFFIHDLEHGYMFFFDEELKTMQLDFFKNIEASFETKIWDKYLGDSRFEERLFYLISDMNTHKEHYRSYLYAMIEPCDIPKFEKIFTSRLLKESYSDYWQSVGDHLDHTGQDHL